MNEGKLEKILSSRKEIIRALEHNSFQSDGINDEESEKSWGLHDAEISSFGATFLRVIPDKYSRSIKERALVERSRKVPLEEFGTAFKSYIEETLSSSSERTHLTAVELGGPGSKLFDGFSQDFFERTVGVCLKDIRDKKEVNTDNANSHTVIEGDILDVKNDTLENKIFQVLGSQKTDLIISRMMGALPKISKHGAILDRLIRNWYGMLNQNGIIFIQFNYANEHYPNRVNGIPGEGEAETQSEHNATEKIKIWVDEIRKKFPKIDVELARGVIRIHKGNGAPEELPPATQLFS